MLRYTIKRILMLPLLLFLASILIFFLLNISKADPVLMMMPSEYTQEDYDAMAAKFGLDKSLPEQYFNWLKNALQGDFGLSYRTKTAVSDNVGFRIPISMKLSFLTTLVIVLLGIPLGVMCAVKQYSAFDSIVNVIAKFMGAIPGFWLGLMLIIAFSVKLKWLPALGLDSWKSWILPVTTLLLPFLANFIRQVRSAMLDCIRQDYVRTARSKGAKERRVIFHDAMKNALMPIITMVGGLFAMMIGGAVVVERVFAIPGLGNAIVDSINARDMPTLLASVMILSIFIIFMQLLIDISYAFIDPRVKSSFVGKKRTRALNKAAKEVQEGGN